MKINIQKIHEKAIIPCYQTEGSAGFDLASIEQTVIPAFSHALIKTGLLVELPEGVEMQIRSRSGLALKNGIQAHFGTIDSDYRGEIGVILFNHSRQPFEVHIGDRIAQGVIANVTKAEFIEVQEVNETERKGGFGSTGVKSNDHA